MRLGRRTCGPFEDVMARATSAWSLASYALRARFEHSRGHRRTHAIALGTAP
jgi:hypothetical protein